MEEIENYMPELRFPEFEGKWEEKRLGDFAEFSKGKGISKSDIVPDGRTPCIRYGELYTDYGVIIHEVFSHTNTPIADLVLSESGDVIVPASGETAMDIATASVVQPSGVALGGDLNIIRSQLDSVFLASYISGKKRNALACVAQGNSVVHIYPAQLGNLKIGTPSLPEQKKIADVLRAIESRITALRGKHNLLSDYKRGIMQQIFEQRIRFKRDDGMSFPDWEETRLGDVFEERNERGNPNAALLSVTLNRGVVSSAEITRASSPSSDRSNYKFVAINDIAYNTMRMWQGASGVSKLSGIVSPAYTVMKPRTGQVPDFWGYAFKLNKSISLFERFSQGLTSDTWSLKYPALSKIKMLVPDPDEQLKITGFLSTIDDKIAVVSDQIMVTEAFKKGLLQKMFV